MKPLLLALRYFKLPFQPNHLSSCYNFTDNPKFGNGRASIRFKELRWNLCLSIYAYIYIIFFCIAFLPVLYVIYMCTSFHVCIYIYIYIYIYILFDFVAVFSDVYHEISRTVFLYKTCIYTKITAVICFEKLFRTFSKKIHRSSQFAAMVHH